MNRSDSLEELHTEAKDHPAFARLRENSNRYVKGDGSINSKVVLVGEAPGENEALTGRPFMGKAGRLLDQLLDIAMLRRDRVYVTNVVKFRPVKNRNPFAREAQMGGIFLRREIKIINPVIVVALGRFARDAVLPTQTGQWGKIYRRKGEGTQRYYLVTYHPAAALPGRDPRGERREAMEDHFANLGLLMNKLGVVSG